MLHLNAHLSPVQAPFVELGHLVLAEIRRNEPYVLLKR